MPLTEAEWTQLDNALLAMDGQNFAGSMMQGRYVSLNNVRALVDGYRQARIEQRNASGAGEAPEKPDDSQEPEAT